MPFLLSQDVEPPEGECLSMVCTPNDQVWVSTALPTGGQLNIYDARTHYKTATWCSKDAVRKLLYNSAEDIVVGITDKELHIFVFGDCTDELKPMLTQPIAESFTEAVLVGAKRKDYKINLWYSVASRLKAITLSACGITSETFRQGESSIVEHMAPLEEAAEGHRLKHLVLSHRACIEKWDVDQMERSAICDCYDLCSNLCDKDCKYMVDFFGSHGTYTMHVPVLFYMLHVHNNIKHPHAKYWWSHLFYHFYVSV